MIKLTPEPPHHARTFVTLDGLRGFAAIAIAIRHAPFLWKSDYPTTILQESYLAGVFFFVLSGFVLAYAYSDRFSTGMSTRQFMIARLIRLYPLYLLAFIISLTMAAGQLLYGKIDTITLITDALFGILFLPSPFSTMGLFPLNIPAWSLFFELIANFVFGFVGKRLNTYVLVATVFAAAVTLLLAVSFGWLGFGTAHGSMDAGSQWRSICAGLARVIYSFFAGVLVFRLWKASGIDFSLPPIISVAALGAVLLSYPSATYQVLFDLFATLFVFPALVFLGACSIPDRRTARLFEWLGGISYGLYVLQMPLYGYVAHAVDHTVGNRFSGVSLFWGAASVAFVVVFTIIIDEYFDRPVRRALTLLVRRPPKLNQKLADATSKG